MIKTNVHFAHHLIDASIETNLITPFLISKAKKKLFVAMIIFTRNKTKIQDEHKKQNVVRRAQISMTNIN